MSSISHFADLIMPIRTVIILELVSQPILPAARNFLSLPNGTEVPTEGSEMSGEPERAEQSPSSKLNPNWQLQKEFSHAEGRPGRFSDRFAQQLSSADGTLIGFF
jgi:hypothetical protein